MPSCGKNFKKADRCKIIYLLIIARSEFRKVEDTVDCAEGEEDGLMISLLKSCIINSNIL